MKNRRRWCKWRCHGNWEIVDMREFWLFFVWWDEPTWTIYSRFSSQWGREVGEREARSCTAFEGFEKILCIFHSCHCFSIVWKERELKLRARRVLIKSKWVEFVLGIINRFGGIIFLMRLSKPYRNSLLLKRLTRYFIKLKDWNWMRKNWKVILKLVVCQLSLFQRCLHFPKHYVCS